MSSVTTENHSSLPGSVAAVTALSSAAIAAVAQLFWGELGASLLFAAVSAVVIYFGNRVLVSRDVSARSAVASARPTHQPTEQAVVVWFTGLPSSGKTTLSLLLKEALLATGRPVEHLDGDAVRAIVPGIGFTRNDRNDHIRRMGFTCSRLEAHGVTVIASFVSPYSESRDFVRGLCKNFVEVFLSTDLQECEKRDVKGLYQQVKDGKRAGMTGVDDPYEPPLNAEIVLDTARQSKEECVRLILERIGVRCANVSKQVTAEEAEKCHGSYIAA